MSAPLEDLYGFLSGAFRSTTPIVDDPALGPACAERVTGNDRLTPAEQVDIYRRQFWLRHYDCLLEDYPGLFAILGEDPFYAFVDAYLTAYPPRAPSLRDLGEDIVVFAERYDGFPGDLRWAALDMVRYENAFVPIFDGEGAPPLDPAKLQALPPEAWETARILFTPLMALLRVEAPVHRIRLAVKTGEPPALPPKRDPQNLVLFRRDLRIQFEELDPLAFDLLSALTRGEPLVPACERLASAAGPEKAAELSSAVGAWFQAWASWGLIVDVAL